MTQENENHPYQIGLALSGGGAKGFAHLGILKALDEKGIRPDVISGTSAGAFAGVLYADGNDPEEILSFFNKKLFKEFAELTIPHTGIFKATRFRDFLKKHLKARNFEDLKIPLKIVATDIAEGVSVIFDKGPLIPAVLSSCAFPIVFTPVEIDGAYYVDGGLFKNFPVSPIRSECKIIIGANVSPLTKLEYKNSLLYIAERSFHYMSASNTLIDRKLCDILIEAENLSKFPMFTLEHSHEIFDVGYEAAIKEFEKKKTVALLKSLTAPAENKIIL